MVLPWKVYRLEVQDLVARGIMAEDLEGIFEYR